MTTLRGYSDGKVIVLDGPVDLPRGEQLVINVEAARDTERPLMGRLNLLWKKMKDSRISDEDAELMRVAIEEARERIDPISEANFD
jgi:hypothetical protein